MPNGRLSKCVIDCRKSTELYHNTSGNAASVSLFANTISTTANTEMTVVVGIASTTLSQKTTMVSASAGTFCSMTTPLYYTDCNYAGVSTFMGVLKGQQQEFRQDNSSCFEGNQLQTGSYPVYQDMYGCNITEMNSTSEQNSSLFVCICGNTCIYGKMYGGNEIHNPSLWMREYPSSCHTCCGGDYFWGGKVIAFQHNTCCECCWRPDSRNVGSSGTWYPINAVHVGMGISECAQSNALQRMINWCCCCGCMGDASVNNGMVPIVRYNGCDGHIGCKCQRGSHCNYQMCRQCACHCCAGGGFKMWNWYALDREFYCCCDGFTGDGAQCWKMKIIGNGVSTPSNYCYAKVPEGTMRSPLWYAFMWCCNCACGCVLNGAIRTCWYFCQPACGCICWEQRQSMKMSSCCNHAMSMCNGTKCFCHPNCSTFMGAPNTSVYNKMSPYGFAFGMTNCSFMVYNRHIAGSDGLCHAYVLTYPDNEYFKCCESSPGQGCYWYQHYVASFLAPTSSASTCYEFPVKYLAWNCHVTNKHGTKGCTYLMVRSSKASHCGVFSFDAHEMRQGMGPYCGESGSADYCCSNLCTFKCFTPDDTGILPPFDKFTKVADFPKEMACDHYFDTNNVPMCVSCLFRADMCTWIINLFNHTCSKWDGFTSSDLQNWQKITDPYSVKVSDILTTFVTSDYACLVDDCNCFFGNIDCSGIIDYKVSVGQYERTGVVLSDGDRVVVNNDSDTRLSFQIWGYEG